MTRGEYQVLLFYAYLYIENPEMLAVEMRALAEHYCLLGRVIVAQEGVNATLEGTIEATEAFIAAFMQDSRFADMQVKRSASTGESFPKLSVKVRNEIVGTGFKQEEADPRIKTAPHLKPEELKQWYESGKEFVVVDMRNSYEFASGHFKNAIDPGLEASRDLPQALPKLEALKNKTVLTVCTGGVRCEKMSAYLLSHGFNNVYQLDGGIHSYMEKYPGQDYEGALYTFDNRLTMDFGGERDVIGTCHHCGGKTERYINCANFGCHIHILVCEQCTPLGTPGYCKDCTVEK